jgi:hypothetical protein
MRDLKVFLRRWMGRSVTIKWALVSYAVLLSFTWIAFSAVAYQNDVTEESIRTITATELAVYTDRIEYDRCVAGFESDRSSRGVLLFVVASSNVSPEFQDEVLTYIEENIPEVAILDACGEPPPPLALGLGQGQRRGDHED